MDYFSKYWNPKTANQASNIALPITNQEQIRSQLRNPIEKKPDGYKNINTSQIQIITGKNPDDR